MSLIGLFTKAALSESIQTDSSPVQKEEQPLTASGFVNELAALLGAGGDQGSLPGPEAAKHGMDVPSSFGRVVSGQSAGGDSAAALKGSVPEVLARAGQVQSVNSQSKTAVQAQAAISDSEAAQAETRPSRPHSSNQLQDSGAAQSLTAVRARVLASFPDIARPAVNLPQLVSGRRLEGLDQPEATSRPFTQEGNQEPDLQPSHRTHLIQRSLPHVALASSAQLSALRPVTRESTTVEQRSKPLSSSPALAAGDSPRTETESTLRPMTDYESSSQQPAAMRPGAASSTTAAVHQAPSSAGRFAEFLQAQPAGLQPDLPVAENQVSKASLPEALRQGLLSETSSVRGAEAEEVVTQIVQNARLLRSQGETRFEVRLKPEFLGKIQIQTLLSADQKTTAARFLVEDPEVLHMLEARLPLLIERLADSGLRIAHLEVLPMQSQDQDGGDAGRSATEAGGQNRQQQGSSRRSGSAAPHQEGSQEASDPPGQPPLRPGSLHLVA